MPTSQFDYIWIIHVALRNELGMNKPAHIFSMRWVTFSFEPFNPVLYFYFWLGNKLIVFLFT